MKEVGGFVIEVAKVPMTASEAAGIGHQGGCGATPDHETGGFDDVLEDVDLNEFLAGKLLAQPACDAVIDVREGALTEKEDAWPGREIVHWWVTTATLHGYPLDGRGWLFSGRVGGGGEGRGKLEILHGLVAYRGARLGDVGAAAEDNADSVEKDEQVEEDAHVLHVIEVVLELAAGILDRGTVGVIDLSPAGDARLHHEALLVIRDGGAERSSMISGALGPGADKRHLAHEDVKQLRNFVDAIFCAGTSRRE